MTYLQNQLNQYETYTYNIQLYMIPPDTAALLDQNISAGRAVLIADNARLAQYNISDLEQLFVVGHNKVRSAFANRFNMTIQEPNGVTLLDTIRKAASRLGIVNHIRALYLIKIEFNGRLSDGKPKKHPQVFYWPIQIRQLQFQVTEGGTTYHIEAIENSTSAYTYLSNVLKDQITIEAETVGEFFDTFVQTANQSAREAIIFSTDAIYNDEIRIEFDPSIESWRQWKFQALLEVTTQGGVNIISVGAGTQLKLQTTVSNGSSITDVVSMILGQTKEYKNVLTNVNGQESMRETPDGETLVTLENLPIFHKVIANVEYGPYDILRGEYQKIITYRIVPYIISDEPVSSIAYNQSVADATIQRLRIENLKRNNLLRKRYDYLFTGKNTEVLELDIRFDRAYYYVTPYGNGRFGDPNVQTPIQSKDRATVLARFKEIADQRQQIANLERQRASVPSSIPAAIQRGGSIGESIIQDFASQIRGLTVTFRNNVRNLEKQLLEDYNMSPENVALAMRFAQDVISDDQIASSDDDNRGGRLKFGALQTNIENASDMVQIELGIRGDPYWLGKPNSFYNSSLQNDDELANFERGLQSFFLRINLPNPVEDTAGRRKPSPEYEVTGLYTVRDVIARYQNGQFTMHLNAVRDLVTNPVVALNDIERNDPRSENSNSARRRQNRIDNAQEQENAFRRISRALLGPQ
jgi:hypothetical protein